jgi:tRNA-uridine 2-sulfurtransferase
MLDVPGKKKVLVAMSGGVDSSVAALSLQRAGYEPVGATMVLWVDPQAEEQAVAENQGCCAYGAVNDALKVANLLGIPHYTFDVKELFFDTVVRNFTDNYKRGTTPNPCVECNRMIKFSVLLKKAAGLGIDYIATGHYVRNLYDTPVGRYRLLRGFDSSKDQSYMLYMLGQQELAKTLFPLGTMTKREVRELAALEKLPVAEKAESQEICFIPDDDYQGFLRRYCPEALKAGDIVSTDGELLGSHSGIAFYTVGQRKGLGLTAARPLYVVRIDAENNRIVAGYKEQLYSKGLVAAQLNFVSGRLPTEPLAIGVKVRYRAPVVEAQLFPPLKDLATVQFNDQQKAVTPGQSVVFYCGEEVIGGGIIKSSL